LQQIIFSIIPNFHSFWNKYINIILQKTSFFIKNREIKKHLRIMTKSGEGISKGKSSYTIRKKFGEELL